jgi:DNA-binding NarL/FixJ family response regulator
MTKISHANNLNLLFTFIKGMVYIQDMLFAAIVEDDKRTGKLLKEYIEGEEVKVTAIYHSGKEAMKTIPTLPLPDVILMDIGLPDISGIEVTKRLKQSYPELEIVMQTVFEDSKTIINAIKAGASGYILKASPKEDIIKALYEVKRGGSFLTGRVAKKVLLEFQTPGEEKKENHSQQFKLTEKESLILRELANGAAYKEIAYNMSISVHTVNNHIRKIYEKLKVHSRGEAVARVISEQRG